ncbi:MAG: PLP-dependent aminotransferase family protein [Erysipelotrichaceae bacterium]
MELFTINFNNNKPKYEQIYLALKQMIINHTIKENECIPSKRALAKHLNTSKNTIELAYEQLIVEGYITSKERCGYYVNKLDYYQSEATSNLVIEPTPSLEYKYDLSTELVDLNLFPYHTFAKLYKNIMLNNPDLLALGHNQGDYNLRSILSKHLKEYRGIECYPEQIVVGAGVEYLIDLVLQLLGRNNTFALEDPGFVKMNHILINHGFNINHIPLDEQGMNINILNKSKANIAYLTPSHQFPTGIAMPIKRRIEILNWANRESNRYIIEDDYDSEFRYSSMPIPAFNSLNRNKTIYLSTFSKTIAPSMRLAFVVLPPSLLTKYKETASIYSNTVSRYEQQTLATFINDGYFTRHLNKMRNNYKQAKNNLIDKLYKMFNEDIEIYDNNSGLHILFKVNYLNDEIELITLAAKHNIKLHSVNEFSLTNTSSSKNIFIFGFAGYNEKDIDAIILSLYEAWKNVAIR